METNENGEVSVMSEVDISEELPNSDDSAFASEDQQHNAHGQEDHGQPGVNTHVDTVTIDANQAGITTDHVFVTTPQGLLTAEQLHEAGIKTTHIVIHDQTLTVAEQVEHGLKTPTTPLPPPTPATPHSREKGIKYQWDESVNSSILPVRCKSSNGELHKAKFGSGGRGRCIKMGHQWYTPSEFEAVCGRASSKDWKRSIRYGGRTLQCLIEDGILQPHATSCTCAACCDDETVTGPVRLFVPYKRRKPSNDGGLPKKRLNSNKSSPTTPVTSPGKENSAVVVSLAPSMTTQVRTGSDPTETIQIIAADASGNIVTGEEVLTLTAAEPTIVMPIPPSKPGPNPTVVIEAEVNEQKQWWQLEEMANNLMQQVHQLKALIEQCKQQSATAREVSVQVAKAQLEKEKAEALHTLRIENQVNLTRAVMEERAQKDIAVQQALAQVRADMQEKMESVQVVNTDDKVTYQVWTHPSGQNNIHDMMEADSDKEKEN